MAKQAITTIKNWFKTSLKPTQQQFWDWLDSFRHLDTAIEITEVSGLREELDALSNPNSTFPEAPTTANTIYGRSGENEAWEEVVPLNVKADKETVLNGHTLSERNLDEALNTTYTLEKSPTQTRRRYFNDPYSSDNYQKADEFYKEVSNGSNNTYIRQLYNKITLALNGAFGFFKIELADDKATLDSKLQLLNVEEKADLVNKYLLIVDAVTGVTEKISVNNIGAGDVNYKGYYLSEAALTTAYPVGQSGWHAYVDTGVGTNVIHFAWDTTDNVWVATGSVQTIVEVPDNNNYLRTLGGWVQGVLKSTYDTFVMSTNSAISTLQTTILTKELIIVPYVSKANLTSINPTTERRIIVSISADATLSFSRALVNGESGVINILNTVALSSTITLPANSIVEGAGGSILVTTGLINSYDRVTWEYDGSKVWWTLGENYN